MDPAVQARKSAGAGAAAGEEGSPAGIIAGVIAGLAAAGVGFYAYKHFMEKGSAAPIKQVI
jgi:hypothetical protein